jgi:endonuclease G
VFEEDIVAQQRSNVSQQTIGDFHAKVKATKAERDQVRRLAARGQWTRAEPDDTRSLEFAMRIKSERGAEAIHGITNDLQPISFLTEGTTVRRAIGKVIVDTNAFHRDGSGFLISPQLFMTNQHVIPDETAAQAAEVVFDYELDEHGRRRRTTRFALDPGRFALFSPEIDGLDYAVIAVGDRIDGTAQLTELGYCALSNTPDRHHLGMKINIIQHPEGHYKKIALRNNLLTNRTGRTLLYETDTLVGSSGSPVFNDDWEVVALHHYGEPFAERKDETGKDLPRELNEGIRISAIYDDLKRRQAGLNPAAGALLDQALRLLDSSNPKSPLPQLVKRPLPARPGG